MIDIKDRICDVVADKVMSAEAAAEFVKDGDNLGVSGFTPSGYPKAVPLALAEKGKKTPFKVNVWTGASVGPEIDQAMVEAGIIDRRLPYQTNGTMRKAINAGKVNTLIFICPTWLKWFAMASWLAVRPVRMLQSLKFAKSTTSAMAK